MNAKLILVSLFVSSVAAAQSSSVEAEALFRQGKQLMADGKIGEACAAFDSSEKLDPSVSTMLNQAACREKNNQLTTAWGVFLEAERQTRDKTDDKSKSYNKVAKEHAAKLEPKLSKLTVNVANQMAGLTIKRNGADVSSAAWNHPLPIDGGTYTIEASAPDHKPWSTQITVANESDSKTVDVPALEAAPKAEPLEKPDAPPETTTTVTKTEPAPSHGSSKVLPIVVGVAGLGLLGGGLALEFSASSTYDKAKLEPDDAKQADLWHSANNKRYAAEGLAAAGVAAVAVSVWLFVRGGGSSESSSATALAPVVSDHGGMLVLTGSM